MAAPRRDLRLVPARGLALLTFALALTACGTDAPAGGGGGDASTPAPDAGLASPSDAGVRPPAVVGLALEPALAALVAVDGARPELVFRLLARLDDGRSREVRGGRFSATPIRVGQVSSQTGRFRANGVIGGWATVTAQWDDPETGRSLTATAAVSVRVERRFSVGPVPADVPPRFDGPVTQDPSRAARLVYPLDGARMPENVFPARVQWLEAEAGDVIRVRIEKPSLAVTADLVAGEPGDDRSWLVDADAWRSIVQTEPEAPALVAVDRFHAATGDVIPSPRRAELWFAPVALTGSVYYWDIAAGRIQRIDDGTDRAVSFMPSPPLAMRAERCVGCHAVSNDGRWMAGRLGGGENIGAVFDLTTDLTGESPPTTFPLVTTEPTSLRWWFASWSPDDRRLVVSADEGGTRALRFYDPFAGAEIAVQGSLPTNATHPAWSPDGRRIAYVTNVDGWGGDYSRGDIAVLPVIGPDAVGTATVVHRGAELSGAPAGAADSYPSWTPDSAWLAFAHGDGCRSETDRAALYMMRPDGRELVRLNRASGGSIAADSFQPRFAPFADGDYYWLSFLSRRDYGNERAGTRGRALQQIWVAAIAKDAPPGTDPSSVGFWLPGQSTASRNISAFWAPRPCRPEGEACSVGSECCSGDCRPDDTGRLECSPPPPPGCVGLGEACEGNGDCCAALVCDEGACSIPPL